MVNSTIINVIYVYFLDTADQSYSWTQKYTVKAPFFGGFKLQTSR